MTDLGRIELAVRRTAARYGGNFRWMLEALADELVTVQRDKEKIEEAKRYD